MYDGENNMLFLKIFSNIVVFENIYKFIHIYIYIYIKDYQDDF